MNEEDIADAWYEVTTTRPTGTEENNTRDYQAAFAFYRYNLGAGNTNTKIVLNLYGKDNEVLGSYYIQQQES